LSKSRRILFRVLLLVAIIAAAVTVLAGQSTTNAQAPQSSTTNNGQSRPQQSGSTRQNLPESALPGAPVAASDLMGRRVDEVHITAVADERAFLKRLPLQPGDTLDARNVRESLRVLFSSGRFADLEADANVLPSGGVAVQFRTKANYFNGRVTVTGLPKVGPSETQIISTGRLELGAQFTEAKLKDSEQRILRLLHEYGFWQAQVTENLFRHEDTQQVDVEFALVPGPPARIGKLTLTGDPNLSDAQAAEISKMQPGKAIRGEMLQRGTTRLRNHYARHKRLRAQITAGLPVFHPETNTVDYNIEVDPGPIVEISVQGYKLSRSKLKKYVPVWEEHAVDEDLLNEGRRNLRDHLEGEGYFDATVQVEQDTTQDHQQIVFLINPKQKHRLRVIQIEGNKRFNTDTIRERMGTQSSGALLPHGRYSQSLVNADVNAIKALYQSNGYADVKVTSQVIQDYEGKRGDMKLLINIDEGLLVKVGRLEIQGSHAIMQAELRSMINTREGQPFSEATVADDRELLLTYYFNRGFPAVQVETAAKYAAGSRELMDVTFQVTEGEQVFVNRVLITGVQRTQPRIVKHAVVIEPGAPLSQERMLQTQRNLYDLGIFNEVQTAIQNPEGVEDYKNVLFQIQEARRWTIDYGFGLEAGSGLNTSQGQTSPQGQTGVSPRGTLNVTRINFRGKAESLIFKSHFGALQRRASLSLDQPHWFDLPNWRMTWTGLYDNTLDVNTFTSNRAEVSAQLTQRVSKATQMLYRFSYRRVSAANFPPGFSTNLIPLFSKPVRVGMPSLTYLRDTRDDPLNSTRGNYMTFDLGIASGIFGSEADFGRFLGQHSSYYKLRRGWVLARSLRLGVETPYGSLDFVPAPEKFFVGGSNSHRGFAINQGGPRDLSSGFPLGGDAMIVNNVELRSPVVPLPFVGENLSFVIFNDVGNAFKSSNDMWHNLWRFSQRNPADCRNLDKDLNLPCDFNYMSVAIGGGIRYRTPIGPVRLDLGYNLNPPFFPVRDPCLGVVETPEHPCTLKAHSDQLHHFNFFFSIGQTF
jgi:outer membrane protein insertion porin family